MEPCIAILYQTQISAKSLICKGFCNAYRIGQPVLGHCPRHCTASRQYRPRHCLARGNTDAASPCPHNARQWPCDRIRARQSPSQCLAHAYPLPKALSPPSAVLANISHC
jgi:hypothetical protein